jgi:hypothetical protein
VKQGAEVYNTLRVRRVEGYLLLIMGLESGEDEAAWSLASACFNLSLAALSSFHAGLSSGLRSIACFASLSQVLVLCADLLMVSCVLCAALRTARQRRGQRARGGVSALRATGTDMWSSARGAW